MPAPASLAGDAPTCAIHTTRQRLRVWFSTSTAAFRPCPCRSPAVLRLQPGESRNPAHLGEYRCETVLLVPATRAFIPLRWRWISCAVVLSDEAFLSRLVVLVFFWFEIRTGALPLNGLVPFVVDRSPSLSNRIQE